MTHKERGAEIVHQLEAEGYNGHKIELILSAAFTAFRNRQKNLGHHARCLTPAEIERRKELEHKP